MRIHVVSKGIALLVIDLQVGAFNGERCPIIAGAEQLLANVRRLIAVARSCKIDVIFVQHCASRGDVLETGTDRWKLHPALEPNDAESVLTKHGSSAFTGTALHDVLQSRGIGDLVLCGLQSEKCISETAISALDLGYSVTIAQDAHSTWPDDGFTASQIVERQNALLSESGAILESTDEFIRRVAIGGA